MFFVSSYYCKYLLRDDLHSICPEKIKNISRNQILGDALLYSYWDGGKGRPSYRFFPRNFKPKTSTPNARICPKNFFTFRFNPGVAYFADIIKIAITLIKTTFQNSIKVKRITIYVLKFYFYFYFPK